jgi:small GTP-binding protein
MINRMPANLPPQYFSLLEKLKKTRKVEEKISILEEMLSICPKHKGTEKVQKDIKSKIAKLKKEIQSKKKTKKEEIFFVKREGAGQIIISGPPNSGKTSLINSLTGANFKVGDYPFTTAFPQPAMMLFEDILIQLVDTPPITKEFFPGWLKNIFKNSDGILAIFDLSKENFSREVEEFKEIVNPLKLEKEIVFVGNKIDLIKEEKKLANFQFLIKISALKKIGLEELKRKIFKMLKVVRVYSKKPGKDPDFEHPFVLKDGSRLIDLANEIHQDLAKNFKFAKLFKKDSKKSILVGKDYLLRDGDILEIHTF